METGATGGAATQTLVGDVRKRARRVKEFGSGFGDKATQNDQTRCAGTEAQAEALDRGRAFRSALTR